MIKVIFIDFDGTLVDSIPLLYGAYGMFMRGFGLQPSKEEFEELNGASFLEIVDGLNQRHGLGRQVADLLLQYGKLLETLYEGVTCFPGARELLIDAKRLGIRIVIVTSAQQKIVEKVLKKEGLEGSVTHIVTAEGLAKGKPDPQIYLQALATADVREHEAIAIEDSVNGIKAAMGAKIAAIWFRPKAELLPMEVSFENVKLYQAENWREVFNILHVRIGF